MEKLVACSTILYDKDIIDKNNEIILLKKKLKYHEIPSIYYSSFQEWYEIETEVENIIREAINNCITENKYKRMRRGILPDQKIKLEISLEKALNLITKQCNKEWAYYNSNELISGMTMFIDTLANTIISFQYSIKAWDFLYDKLNYQDMRDIIYNNITEGLDNIKHDIPIFNCRVCKKNINYNDMNEDNNICYHCEALK